VTCATSHQILPDLLSLASILDASRQVCNTVFDSVCQALEAVADSLGASGVVDGLTESAARGAYEATSGTRDAAHCSAELGGHVRDECI